MMWEEETPMTISTFLEIIRILKETCLYKDALCGPGSSVVTPEETGLL